MARIPDPPGIPPTALRVLRWFARRKPDAWHSRLDAERQLGLDERTLRRSLARLTVFGLVERDGKWRPTRSYDTRATALGRSLVIGYEDRWTPQD